MDLIALAPIHAMTDAFQPALNAECLLQNSTTAPVLPFLQGAPDSQQVQSEYLSIFSFYYHHYNTFRHGHRQYVQPKHKHSSVANASTANSMTTVLPGAQQKILIY